MQQSSRIAEDKVHMIVGFAAEPVRLALSYIDDAPNGKLVIECQQQVAIPHEQHESDQRQRN
jgi:hypothetical protein